MELTDIKDEEENHYDAGYRAFIGGYPASSYDKDAKIDKNLRDWMDGWSDAFMDSIGESKHHEFDESITV